MTDQFGNDDIGIEVLDAESTVDLPTVQTVAVVYLLKTSDQLLKETPYLIPMKEAPTIPVGYGCIGTVSSVPTHNAYDVASGSKTNVNGNYKIEPEVWQEPIVHNTIPSALPIYMTMNYTNSAMKFAEQTVTYLLSPIGAINVSVADNISTF